MRVGIATVLLVSGLLMSGLLVSGCTGIADRPGESTPAGPAGVMLPPAGRFDYQIGGAYPPARGTAIVTRDRHDPPAPGTYSICYVNAFQTQPEETAWWRSEHPDLVLPVEDPQWPGEYLLDLSTPATRTAAAAVVGGWIDGCAAAGYRAVEPDNLDSWTRSGGRLTSADAEECEASDECPDYLAVYGTRVLEIEYAMAPFEAACTARRGNPVVLRDRAVVPAGRPGHTSRTC
jgi:Glycoside-hydrolase family GH114